MIFRVLGNTKIFSTSLVKNVTSLWREHCKTIIPSNPYQKGSSFRISYFLRNIYLKIRKFSWRTIKATLHFVKFKEHWFRHIMKWKGLSTIANFTRTFRRFVAIFYFSKFYQTLWKTFFSKNRESCKQQMALQVIRLNKVPFQNDCLTFEKW